MFGNGYKNVYSAQPLSSWSCHANTPPPGVDVCVCESLSCWRFDTLSRTVCLRSGVPGLKYCPPPQDAFQQLPGLVGFTERGGEVVTVKGGGGDVYYSHSLFGLRINLAAIHKQYDLNILGGAGLGVASPHKHVHSFL